MKNSGLLYRSTPGLVPSEILLIYFNRKQLYIIVQCTTEGALFHGMMYGKW